MSSAVDGVNWSTAAAYSSRIARIRLGARELSAK
jgi:hypothetical protein